MKSIAIFGLGEAGGLFATELATAGLSVKAFDPAEVATPAGVERCSDPAAAVVDTDAVFSLTAAADALTAIRQAQEAIPASAIYADFSTAPASLKKDLAGIAAIQGFGFADVALLAIVPGNGIATTALVSGTGAEAFVALMTPLGMPVQSIGKQAGAAATRKLLRSVMMKGLAAVTCEAMRAAERAGCADWLWDNLSGEITKADAATLARLIHGTGLHAERRLHEMEASAALLEELGIEPVMTRSTVESLRRVPAEGVPSIPDKAVSG